MCEIHYVKKELVKKKKASLMVLPSDDIYRKLGNNSYNFLQILCELIDNSLAARLNQRLNVRINLFYEEDDSKEMKLVRVEIVDDASGIAIADLATAISPGANSTEDGLNEHGMGMKQAIAALGVLHYLITKTKEDDSATLIDTLRFGDIETYEVESFREHGTTISIQIADSKAYTCRKELITKYLVPLLGATYRYFLKEDNKQMNLTVALIKEGNTQEDQVWDVQEVKPIYFHPTKAINAPVIQRYLLCGNGWMAELTFGYAPTEDQLTQDLGMDPLPSYHPYRVTNNHQGIDVLVRNRVVMFHQLKELDLVGSQHPQYNHIRGELNLLTGFSTTVTKNGVKRTRAFQECLQQVYDILHGHQGIKGAAPKDYLKTETAPEGLPEALLTHRLVKLLENMGFYTEIYPELPIEGVGRIDIFATKKDGEIEIFEMKAGASKAQDVFQLFMYMVFKGVKQGKLVASKHSIGSKYARATLVKSFETFFPGLSIELKTHEDYNLQAPATREEREKFFNASKAKKTTDEAKKKRMSSLFKSAS